MKQLEIDSRWQRDLGLVLLGVAPRTDFETGAQAVTQDGRLRWSASVAALGLGGESFAVTFPAEQVPDLSVLEPVWFSGLRCGGSQAGLWFAADAIVQDEAADQDAFEEVN